MKQQKNQKALGWLWRVCGNGKWNILILSLIQAVLAVSSVYFAWLLWDMIDCAVAKDLPGFRGSALWLVGVIVLQLALRAVKRYLDEFTKAGLENRCKQRLFATLLSRDFGSVTAVHSGEWMNRLTSDTVVVADCMTIILPDLVGMIVRLVGALAALLVLIPELRYAIVPGVIFLLGISYAFRKLMKNHHKLVQKADGDLRVLLSDRLSGLLIVRSFAREEQTVAEARDAMKKHRAARIKRANWNNICNICFGLLMNGVYLFGSIYCGYGILTGSMTYGSFTAVLQLIGQIQSPFANLTGYLPKFYAMIASAERLMEAENYAPAAPNGMLEAAQAQAFYDQTFVAMALENATFSYRPPVQEDSSQAMPIVLQNLDLQVRKGEYVAFTGHSGCGKSTILKLFMSLYPLDGGSRSICCADGSRQVLDARFARLFAYVPQGNQLMAGSIREMVAFSDREKMRDDAAILRALEIACADDFVCALPQGMDTLLGERGLGLSEGQMQRIAIARAIFSDNPILVLDESTSALDEETEQRLLEKLRTMTDKTVLIVTHRPAALAVCDRQVILTEAGICIKETPHE